MCPGRAVQTPSLAHRAGSRLSAESLARATQRVRRGCGLGRRRTLGSRKADAAGSRRGSLCLEGSVAGRIICDDKTHPSSLRTKASREGLTPSLLLEREGESGLGSHGVRNKAAGQTELFSD